MSQDNQSGEVETRTRNKVLSLHNANSGTGIFSNGKLYAAISTKSADFELTQHTQGPKSGLATGMIHDRNGIAEHVGFIEFTAPAGQVDIGAIYHISRHLDVLSYQVDRLNRSLGITQARQEDILTFLHTSLLASLKQAGCDFKFALRNLDTIVEKQLQSAYLPAVIVGIQNAEKALHEKTLHWEQRLKTAQYDHALWSKMPGELESSVYFKALFVAAIGHAAQALLMDGTKDIVELSRLKLHELAAPLRAILHKCKDSKEWIYSMLEQSYDPNPILGMHRWDIDTPDVAISKIMTHADRMLEAVDYLVSLSFIDHFSPNQAFKILEVSSDLEQIEITPPLPVPEAILNLLMDR